MDLIYSPRGLCGVVVREFQSLSREDVSYNPKHVTGGPTRLINRDRKNSYMEC